VEQKSVGAHLILNGANYRDLKDGALLSMVGSLAVDEFVILMFPKWWENYVRLHKTVKLLSERYGMEKVKVHFACTFAGEMVIYPIDMPTADTRNAVMMSFDSLIGGIAGMFEFLRGADQTVTSVADAQLEIPTQAGELNRTILATPVEAELNPADRLTLNRDHSILSCVWALYSSWSSIGHSPDVFDPSYWQAFRDALCRAGVTDKKTASSLAVRYMEVVARGPNMEYQKGNTNMVTAETDKVDMTVNSRSSHREILEMFGELDAKATTLWGSDIA
jgi:hypothetical protein